MLDKHHRVPGAKLDFTVDIEHCRQFLAAGVCLHDARQFHGDSDSAPDPSH
jgi:hypothetical protein